MFNRAEKWSESLWNMPSSAYMRMGWPEVVVHVLVWMHWSGLKLDIFAFSGIVKAAQELESSEYLQRMLHGCVMKVGSNFGHIRRECHGGYVRQEWRVGGDDQRCLTTHAESECGGLRFHDRQV
jgi:hypothetical protein